MTKLSNLPNKRIVLIFCLIFFTSTIFGQSQKVNAISIGGNKTGDWVLIPNQTVEIIAYFDNEPKDTFNGYALFINNLIISDKIANNQSVDKSKKTVTFTFIYIPTRDSAFYTILRGLRAKNRYSNLLNGINLNIGFKKDSLPLPGGIQKNIDITYIYFSPNIVEKIWIDGRANPEEWRFIPGRNSRVSIQLTDDLPKDPVKKFILFIDGFPLTKVSPVGFEGGNILNYQFDYSESQLSEWRDLYKAKTETDLKDVSISVGPEGGQPLGVNRSARIKEVFLFSEYGKIITGVLALLLVLILLILIFYKDYLRDPCDLPAGQKKPYSLSRFQFAVWNLVILFSVIYTLVMTGKLIPPSLTILGLLGISGAQFVVGDFFSREQVREHIAEQKKEGKSEEEVEKCNASKGFFNDILSSDKGLGLHRFQNLIWSIFIWIFFVQDVIKTLVYPELNEALLALTGFSAAIYGIQKSNEAIKDPSSNGLAR